MCLIGWFLRVLSSRRFHRHRLNLAWEDLWYAKLAGSWSWQYRPHYLSTLEEDLATWNNRLSRCRSRRSAQATTVRATVCTGNGAETLSSWRGVDWMRGTGDFAEWCWESSAWVNRAEMIWEPWRWKRSSQRRRRTSSPMWSALDWSLGATRKLESTKCRPLWPRNTGTWCFWTCWKLLRPGCFVWDRHSRCVTVWFVLWTQVR